VDNVLGTLLRAITNLLNGGLALPLSMIVSLLNQILASSGSDRDTDAPARVIRGPHQVLPRQ
jgi:hypothetical protein